MVKKYIFFDYAILAAPRDTIFGMYAHMTARNDIRYIYLLSMFIRGHQRSIEVTLGHQRSHVNNNTQIPNFLHVCSNFYQNLHKICKVVYQDH